MRRAAAVLYLLHVHDLRKRTDGEHTRGVVDEDNTSMSREVVRTVEAVPTFKVTHRYVDETAARRATQSKEIYGYLVIPTGFTADAIAGRQATLATTTTMLF
mgnify:FL=1